MITDAGDWLGNYTVTDRGLTGAAEAALRELAASLDGDARFRALLAANAIGVGERETHARERLALLAAQLPPDVAGIRAGKYDDSGELFGPLYAHVILRAWIADGSPDEPEIFHVYGSVRTATFDPGLRFSLAGRVAIVTGASGSLGRRFAETLAGAGAAVALAARRVDVMEALRDRLAAGGAKVAVVEMDVADAASVEAGVAAAEAALGPVDVVVNNSGIAAPGSALEQSDADFARVMAVNLDGARRVSVAVARRLIAAKRPGAIVNVASILGLRQGAGVSAYAVSKAALIQLTQQHALEWARHRIRVNALAPGYIRTDLNRAFFASEAGQAQIKRIPQRRLGSADELDGALLLLASDAGSYITGAVLVADGGHLVSPL